MKNKALRVFLCLLLTLALLLPGMPGVRAAETAETSDTEEAGKKTLRISTVQQFLAFAERCRLDAYSQGLTVSLDRDLDLSEVEFNGIPLFCGTFQGNHHTITGFHLTAAGSNLGLFRYLAPGSQVWDLKVRGTVAPEGSQIHIGGIAGSNAGTIKNCIFDGQISGEDRVGSIAGINQMEGIIEDCRSEGSLTGSHFLGGIAGENRGVIRDCSNWAKINTVAQESSVMVSNISLDTITGTEAANTVTDIGGISGSNVGVIRDCSNHETVGYPHIGYNVGGITGSHLGYLTDCVNYGDVFGRKEAGGIAGQFEPISVILYQQDTLQILEQQMSATSALLNQASYNAHSHMGAVGSYVHGMQDDADMALAAIEDLLSNEFTDPDTLTAVKNVLVDSYSSMQYSMYQIAEQAGSAAGQLSRDIQAVSSQMNAMGQTIRDAKENLGIRLTDISDEDVEELTDGKLSDSQNYGSVSGDLNAGGIAGAIALENDLDPEDDLMELGNRSINLDATLRAVILRCDNHGTVEGRKTSIGGIAGWLTMGLIRECTNTGKINAPKAQYVGGIAGNSMGYIRKCYVKCGIVADQCVGGIAGNGTVVTDCRSMVTVRDGKEKLGAVLGIREAPQNEDIENPISGNLYMSLSRDLGAIDGISYQGLAEPMPPSRFQKLEELPAALKKSTLTFRDENGVQTKRLLLPLGSVLKQEDIPPVPPKEGCNGQWKDISYWQGQKVYFDTVFVPEYTPHRITISSTQERSSGRPILLAEGTFPELENIELKAIDLPVIPEQNILEAWEISPLSETENTVLHLSQPDTVEAEHLALLVQQSDGSWAKRETTVNARYLIFSLSPEETSFCIAEVPDYSGLIKTVVVSVTVILLAALWITVRIVKKRKASRKPPEVQKLPKQ